MHASPRSARSKGARLCRYHRWFARIGPVPEPYCQLPMSDRCMRERERISLVHALACAACFVFDLVLTLRPLRWAGGCAWQGLPASALSAQPCMWAMRGTMFLSPLLLMTFVVASSIFSRTVMGPCVFSCGTHARERERENFTSPFSQHWLMRTRLCWSHQPH